MPEIEHPTEEMAITGTDGELAPGLDGTGAAPWEAAVSHDDEWPDRGPRRGVRMSVPTMALLVLLIAAGGIWGGAALQRAEGTTSGSTAAASSFASLFRGRSGATGGGFANALAGATAGTVTEVQGSTLYVTDASGALVKVTVGPSTTVDRNAASSLGSLQVGDTVIVQGTKASNGSVAATSVSATAAGVTSGFARPGATGTPTGG